MKLVDPQVATAVLTYIVKAFGNPIPGPHLVAYYDDGRMQGSGLSPVPDARPGTNPFTEEYQKILVETFANLLSDKQPSYVASCIRTEIIMPGSESTGKATHLLVSITKADGTELGRYFANLCPCGCGKHQQIMLPLEMLFPKLDIPCPLTPGLLKLLAPVVHARPVQDLVLRFSAN
jgi:hypothetical protein